MQQPNARGVYPAEVTEELVRIGRSYAAISMSQCDDGLYRHSIDYQYSYGGASGPITLHTKGYASLEAARLAATQEMIARFPCPTTGAAGSWCWRSCSWPDCSISPTSRYDRPPPAAYFMTS